MARTNTSVSSTQTIGPFHRARSAAYPTVSSSWLSNGRWFRSVTTRTYHSHDYNYRRRMSVYCRARPALCTATLSRRRDHRLRVTSLPSINTEYGYHTRSASSQTGRGTPKSPTYFACTCPISTLRYDRWWSSGHSSFFFAVTRRYNSAARRVWFLSPSEFISVRHRPYSPCRDKLRLRPRPNAIRRSVDDGGLLFYLSSHLSSYSRIRL